MKFLFFDLECSNCFNGNNKVCEYGAVLTDENFKIIAQYDIPMNPGNGRDCRFDTSIYKRDPDFDWAYDFDYYYSCPYFSSFYAQIRKMMEDEDVIVFGYSVDNDIRYLYSACEQYNLKQINFKTFDVQLIKREYSKAKQEVKGLKGAFLEFYEKKELSKLVPHLSRDDAKMTMMVFKAICNKMEMTPFEILDLCENCSYDSNKHISDYLTRKEDRKLHPEKYIKESKNQTNHKCQVTWGNFYKEYLDKLDNEESLGKIVTISSKLKENMDDLSSAINTIKDNGLIASDKIDGSDFIVVLDENDKERLNSCLKRQCNGKMVMLQDFKNLFKEEKACYLI